MRNIRPKDSITKLFDKLERVAAADKLIPDEEEKRWNANIEKGLKIGRQIVQTRALSAAEMLLKIRAVMWYAVSTEHVLKHGFDRNPEDPKDESFVALASLRDDIKRLYKKAA
jgi:hypothetical protein